MALFRSTPCVNYPDRDSFVKTSVAMESSYVPTRCPAGPCRARRRPGFGAGAASSRSAPVAGTQVVVLGAGEHAPEQAGELARGGGDRDLVSAPRPDPLVDACSGPDAEPCLEI